MAERTQHISAQRTTAEGSVPLSVQAGTETLTPVYGTAEPSSGLAERIRLQAYRHPAHDPRRWLLLLTADRVESTGYVARESVTPGRQGQVVRHFSRQARAHPSGAAALGLGLAGLLLWAHWRRSR